MQIPLRSICTGYLQCYAYIRTKYPIILENNDLKRIEFLAAYKLSKTKVDKEILADQARNYLNEVLPANIFPEWYGTPWSFNGNAQYQLNKSIALVGTARTLLINRFSLCAGSRTFS